MYIVDVNDGKAYERSLRIKSAHLLACVISRLFCGKIKLETSHGVDKKNNLFIFFESFVRWDLTLISEPEPAGFANEVQ